MDAGVNPSSSIRRSSRWLRLLAGLGVVFGLFHGSANALGSDRGQAGVIVCGLVVAATLVVERVFFGGQPAAAARSLGLGRPAAKGMLVASCVSLILLCIIPGFALASGETPSLAPDWLALLPGLFAQGGIAEELLFRGYLFGRIRRGRSFWHAAGLATLPFVAVHLLLFLTLPWVIAVASVLLAVALSFPLARLYELGGATIWPPALLHFVVQGAVKVVVVSNAAASSFAILWMAASAAVPALVLVIPRSRLEDEGPVETARAPR